MRRILAVMVLSSALWLGNVGDASACRFSCCWGWGCGWGCSPCWSYCYSPCYYPCYSYCYSPCYSYYYTPCYSYCYTPCYTYSYPTTYYYPTSTVIGSSAAPASNVAVASSQTRIRIDQPRPVTPTVLVSNKSGDQPANAIPAKRARVVVTLPADARLTVEGKQIKTSDGKREFLTPELEPGATYRYAFKAEVTRNNRVVSETREVRVRAGQETLVSFELPATQVATASR